MNEWDRSYVGSLSKDGKPFAQQDGHDPALLREQAERGLASGRASPLARFARRLGGVLRRPRR